MQEELLPCAFSIVMITNNDNENDDNDQNNDQLIMVRLTKVIEP